MPQVRAGVRGWWILGAAVLILCLGSAYVWSVATYRSGLEKVFAPPAPRADGVVVQLVPFSVDAAQQFVATELTIYPGSDLLTAEGRLTRDIAVDVVGLAARTVTFAKGTVPSPVTVDLPALGLVQQYPFDTYVYDVQVRTFHELPGRSNLNPPPVPMTLAVFFKVPGWNSTPEDEGAPSATGPHAVAGMISRDGATRTIAIIFIALMIMFAALSVTAVVAGVRRRLEFTVGTAAWLTGAVFALVSLRNGLPGNPPIGSWMDILAYFWVIAVIMLMIGVVVVVLVVRGNEEA